jgi:hypothetical protein
VNLEHRAQKFRGVAAERALDPARPEHRGGPAMIDDPDNRGAHAHEIR